MSALVAVIGCGRMGRIRAEAATRCGARVVELCDPDADRAAELASSLPGCAVREAPEALSWDRLDALFVCTPPSVRGAVELRAIERGLPFMVEKPVGLSAPAVARVAEALARRPVLTAVGYMNRYRPSVLRARELLREAPVLGASCHWVGTRYKVPWWPREELSGGPVNEQTTHLVDLARFLVGEVVEVQGLADTREEELPGATASFNLRLASGGLFSLFYSCSGANKMIGLRLFSADREIVLDGWDFRLDDPSLPVEEDRNAVFHAEVDAFLQAIESGDASLVRSDYADALRTQAAVDTLLRSLRTGKVEPVPSLA